MSDVERICTMNQERRRWAEEYHAQYLARENRKNAERKRKTRLHGTTLLCAVFVGVGLTLMWIGMEAMQLHTLIFGLITALGFCLLGGVLEELNCE